MVVERDAPAVSMRRGGTGWIPSSSRDFYRDVTGVARALREWGIAAADRVAILGENRPEWTIADFASMLLGAVVVPIYPTLTAEQTAYILNDSGTRVMFVSNEIQLQKITSIRSQTAVERIVVMDEVAGAGHFFMDRMMRAGAVERDAELDNGARAVRAEDLATIIYTSGTTGVPKGAMLTHGNMAANIAHSLDGYDLGPGDRSMSFLPLSHVTARHLDLAMLHRGVTLAYVPAPDQLAKALLEVHPTLFVGVPRVYEKIHTQVVAKARGFPEGCDSGLGGEYGTNASRGNSGATEAGIACLEAREPDGVLEGACGHGGEGAVLYLGRRAVGAQIGGVVCRYGHSHS